MRLPAGSFFFTGKELPSFTGKEILFLPEKNLRRPRLLFFPEEVLCALSVLFLDEAGSSVPGTHPIEALSLSISGASSMAVLSAVIRS